MFPLYSLLLTFSFLIMLPLFYLRRQKYAAGFNERLGNYPEFRHDGRPVIWLHCVSVGETNAARPLVKALRERFPAHRLVVSTTTKTGQELARTAFKNEADAVFYFPYDWKFSVRRALKSFKPSIVLLMETEIWPRFIHEARLSGAKVAFVNGRLSERSFRRYSWIGGFVNHVLCEIDLALVQDDADAGRLTTLGMISERVEVTGNIKFDHADSKADSQITEELRRRFGITGEPPLIVAASTHEPEEKWILEALESFDQDFRLMIAPRHPERFAEVASIISGSGLGFVRRSTEERPSDREVRVILLDTIGELRAVYPLADIVFVGGSLIPHGGQSVLEPAAAGRAIVTGPHTHNFDAVVKEFLMHKTLIQLPEAGDKLEYSGLLSDAFTDLLSDPERRRQLGDAAYQVMESNRGAAEKTVDALDRVFFSKDQLDSAQ
jgi:3-deoxy-D-manno-octulosonic-acid transferase